MQCTRVEKNIKQSKHFDFDDRARSSKKHRQSQRDIRRKVIDAKRDQ